MTRNRSRTYLTLGAAVLLGGALVFAFWPRPMAVDYAEVTRGTMQVTIDEQGRTRVSDAYIVSTPVAGRLLRVDVEPGDQVVRGETVIAQMLPAAPDALDVRTREQARASVSAAEAGLRLARAELNKAMADHEFAKDELKRVRQLEERGIASGSALDRAQSEARKALAALETAEAAIAMREAELANARARLIGFDDRRLAAAIQEGGGDSIPLTAPATGRILRVMQQSETTLAAGTQIMEIGNVEGDLEVVVELLSGDAVKVRPGDRAIIRDWGGEEDLEGRVMRVDPFGFTKFSALGVEEQRVNAVIGFSGNPGKRTGLGHGYRVEVNIVIWQTDDAVIVPSSAIFRDDGTHSMFRVEDGEARRVEIETGRDNGVEAEIISGLAEGDTVVLYPPPTLEDGMSVTRRIAQ